MNAIYFGALAALYELSRLIANKKHPVSLIRIGVPAIAVLLAVIWAVIQISPIVPKANQHPIWDMTRDALGEDFQGYISIYPDETMLTILKAVTAISVFWVTLQITRNPSRARQLIAAVAVIGLVYAAYGIVAFFLFPQTILWYPKYTYNESVTSTFVNRNSYATYAGLGLLCALAMSFSHFINVFRSTSSPSQTFALLIAHVAGRGGMWIAAVGVIAIAWIMTGSRGGTIATIAGIIVLAGLAAIRGRRRAGLSSGILIVSVLIIGVTATTYGDFLADRLNSQGLQSDDRLIVYYLTYQSLFQSPWTGLGWGTFRQAFPMYRGTEIDPRIVYDLAHNTYLELFQGLGIPAALLVLFGILVFVGHCFHGCVTRRHSATAPLVAVAATTLVALHALVDFSLQMQSITLTWVAILATGVSQSWSSRDATQD